MSLEFADALERMAACINQLDEEWMVFGEAALTLHGISLDPQRTYRRHVDRRRSNAT